MLGPVLVTGPSCLLVRPHLLELFGEDGHHLEEVGHDAVVGHFEYGGFGVLVDGHDILGGFHPR